MRVGLGADHAGFALKEELRSLLAGREVEVVDFGTHSADRVDYPDVAHAVAQAVADGHLDRAVLVCGTGVGMAIAANKVPGVRAAHASDTYTARLARAHNDAQILTIGGRVLGSGLATELVTVFLDTPFDGGRHADRVAKLEPALPLAGRTVSTP